MLGIKRVLHVVGAMNRAGTETMLMNIYRKIDREKVQFDFISYSHDDAHYDEEIRSLGGRVIKLTNTKSIKELYQAIKRYGPYDVVHSHTLFHCGISNIAAKLAGCKIRISHAHTTLDESERLIRKIYMKSMRSIINLFSTKQLACSQEASNYLFGRNVETTKYEYFPNCIDYPSFLHNPNEEEVRRFKNENKLNGNIVIGHVGRFIEAKNHLYLLEILKVLLTKQSKIKLLLVGDGHLRAQIEELTNKNGLYDYICFAGMRDDVSTMFNSMDAFVFPSIYEGLGLVLLEAQASGLPCIVSEAIQPEADLNMGLVTRLNLSDGAEKWAEMILGKVNKKEKDKEKILSSFEQSGYSITAGISRLMELYQV